MAKKKFNLELALYTAINNQIVSEGTNMLGAFRDVLTDLMHIAHNQGIEFKSRLKAAEEVYTEERATCEDCGKKLQQDKGNNFTLCTKCQNNYPD